MIVEIILSIPPFVLIWFLIFKVVLKIKNKKMLKNIPDKIEKQDKKFYNNGKEISLKKAILGAKEIKKEVIEKQIPEIPEKGDMEKEIKEALDSPIIEKEVKIKKHTVKKIKKRYKKLPIGKPVLPIPPVKLKKEKRRYDTTR